MKPSEPSLHFQAHVQFFRKVIVVGLGKTYSIPKCHLQRAQLSQKNNFFFFFKFLQFCQGTLHSL